MDAISASALLSSSPLELQANSSTNGCSINNKRTNASSIPVEFVWPEEDLVSASQDLMAPVVDLNGFFKGDEEATRQAVSMIKSACSKHGFFQVINHGVDPNLIATALDHLEKFFRLPVSEKMKAGKVPGSAGGYSGAHADRFSSKLPWKETLSVGCGGNLANDSVVDYFVSTLGKDFEQTGVVYQNYSEAMKELSLSLLELLAISLGVDRKFYRDFFQDDLSIIRCNFYPSCKEPSLTLGTGPHCDPTSLTILHQDEVGGLEVYSNNIWQRVPPVKGALVINIGDTFMALTNGIYKSCLHRAVVNDYKDRASLAFFLCPKGDKIVRPPNDLVPDEHKRLYPDFTWTEFFNFTQKTYRADESTFPNFTKWVLCQSSKVTNETP